MALLNRQIAAITDQLYLCGIANINEDNLARKNITHVLNTAQELEDFKYPGTVQCRHILMRDAEDEDLLKFLDACVDHIDTVCQGGGRILVHCVAGVSRSASVCLAYLVKCGDMSLRNAYYRILHKRPCIFPNFGFWRQLVQYEEKLRGSSSVELLPFVLGPAPDLYVRDVEYRIKLAWMRELMLYWLLHLVVLTVQVISTAVSE